MSTDLDTRISSALQQLARPVVAGHAFDAEEYIGKFSTSARAKAKTVIQLLQSSGEPFCSKRPVFISIGGGDGEELVTLLGETDGQTGILIEGLRSLAERARQRAIPSGKRLEVLEGDAQRRIVEAVDLAKEAIRTGAGDFLVVTCHAVIHELYNRSEQPFDLARFLGTIFGNNDFPIWFTYREPGTPEKWPKAVLVRAACSPNSLLQLAKAIIAGHSELATLTPQPHVFGDGVRLHKTIGMEMLAKLFYLEDLVHEIEERSTAVDHSILQNTLLLAIGDTAVKEGRASVKSMTAPTASFENHWLELGVEVNGLDERNNTVRLGIAESQTRLVGWRRPSSSKSASKIIASPSDILGRALNKAESTDIPIAWECLREGDSSLLESLLLSRGRYWVESVHKGTAVELLKAISEAHSLSPLTQLWTHYLLGLVRLFSGNIELSVFSEDLEAKATVVGLGPLFRSERMEFLRKAGNVEEAVEIANTLSAALPSTVLLSAGDLERYVVGTSKFLLGNLMRFGGLYRRAWSVIDSAQNIYKPGIQSHATELAHCHYAKAICVAVTGVSSFDLQIEEETRSTRQFASALIELSYSHAAWFVGDVTRATSPLATWSGRI